MTVRLRKLLLFFAAFAALARGAAGAAERRPPDIVIFLADDMGWADSSVYGGVNLVTPNIERLARDGVTFTHAFVASPSCAPSRAALLTALDPMRSGAMRNHSRPRADVKKWPAYFQELGYEVAAIGKVAHYAQVREYGFDHCSHFKYHEDDCVEAAVDWLEKRVSRKPLCLLVGTNWPHVPWPREGRVDPAAIKLPPTQVETPETRQAWSRYLEAVALADRDLGQVYDAARKRLNGDTLFIFSSDHGAQFPFGKWNAYDAGVRTPLIISWPGKIAPGSTSPAMVSWIDLLPTCLDAAGGTEPANVSGRSFLSILQRQTAEHRSHVFITHSADKRINRFPIRAVRTRNWKYIRNLDPGRGHHTHVDQGANPLADGRIYWDSWARKAADDPAAAETVRRYHTRPAEELYDLRNDPHEMHNLAADDRHSARKRELRELLDSWMRDQGDKGLETERALSD